MTAERPNTRIFPHQPHALLRCLESKFETSHLCTTIFLMICPPGQIILGMKRLPIEPSKLASFCEANGIRKLSLFGSQLHDTARPDSDIDLLVEFYPDRIPGLFALAGMELELSDMLGGKKVDLRTPLCLSRYFRNQVVNEAARLYGN